MNGFLLKIERTEKNARSSLVQDALRGERAEDSRVADREAATTTSSSRRGRLARTANDTTIPNRSPPPLPYPQCKRKCTSIHKYVGRGVHHMVGCMSKSYGRVAENHELSHGRPLYHVMSGCYRFLEVSTI